jgi:hypothetical protein
VTQGVVFSAFIGVDTKFPSDFCSYWQAIRIASILLIRVDDPEGTGAPRPCGPRILSLRKNTSRCTYVPDSKLNTR